MVAGCTEDARICMSVDGIASFLQQQESHPQAADWDSPDYRCCQNKPTLPLPVSLIRQWQRNYPFVSWICRLEVNNRGQRVTCLVPHIAGRDGDSVSLSGVQLAKTDADGCRHFTFLGHGENVGLVFALFGRT